MGAHPAFVAAVALMPSRPTAISLQRELVKGGDFTALLACSGFKTVFHSVLIPVLPLSFKAWFGIVSAL
jgi:hypothetical protein